MGETKEVPMTFDAYWDENHVGADDQAERERWKSDLEEAWNDSRAALMAIAEHKTRTFALCDVAQLRREFAEANAKDGNPPEACVLECLLEALGTTP